MEMTRQRHSESVRESVYDDCPYCTAAARSRAPRQRAERIGGLMLGWTLGGHPSPNLEAAVAGLEGRELESVARRRHGDALVPAVVEAWRLISAEIAAAKRLHQLQSADSRIGFEATNHYFYVPLDLVEKVVHCRWLLDETGGG